MNNPTLSNADFGLIGYPLGHSFSKMFFTRLFREDGSGRTYENFELPELTAEALYSLVLMNPKLKGFNVTAPYKEAILPFLDSTDELAREVGAVNTVKIRRAPDGRVVGLDGYNTDVRGFLQSILGMLGGDRPSGALILGTGGASKAVAVALHRLAIPTRFVSRSKSDASTITYSQIDADILREFPLIVNATPLGTYPNTDACPPIPYDLLTADNLCFDLVYNPETTKFMAQAAEKGAKVKNGLEMLFGQAIEALDIWTSEQQ